LAYIVDRLTLVCRNADQRRGRRQKGAGRQSAWAGREPLAAGVGRLSAYRGIAELTALTLAAGEEAGRSGR
jgi:hypothetical protein